MSLDQWLSAAALRREQTGLTRNLRARAAGERLVDLAGNDYLGLSTDPRVVAAACEAARQWGAGAGASRLVTGTTELHVALEVALAEFTGQPAALVFSSGYHANLGAVTALSDSDTLIVSDAHVHASLVDACRLARRSRMTVVPHNDVGAVEDALRRRAEARALVLCESVYSVAGDAAPVAELVAVAARYDAVLIVDEAHAIGVSGPGGRGLMADVGPLGSADVVVTVTLSKALASQGGAVLGTPRIVEHLVNTARPFIYDTALAPAAAGAALAAIGVVTAEPQRAARVVATGQRLSTALGVARPAGAVLSLPVAGPSQALEAQSRLRDEGFMVGAFRPPSVPDRVSRLRLTARGDLADADLDRLLRALSPIAAMP